jgi:DNA modification methylase
MITLHTILNGDSRNMMDLEDDSIDLIVTSPPYPMVSMWDNMFIDIDSDIKNLIELGDGNGAFNRMHLVLDEIWDECYRVLKPGGFACINIGDATRTINGNFSLYSNHSRIISSCLVAGFTNLPCIIWRKQTNSPNKFMGSGVMPAGAYVTLEHEYILVFRKGNKREFKSQTDKYNRRMSSIFWEERNKWFSDIWTDLKGTSQKLGIKNRERNASFPFELSYRLINMYSVMGDTVLDPFLGAGTTTFSAMSCSRNSYGYELDSNLMPVIKEGINNVISISIERVKNRIENHNSFVKDRISNGKELKHYNKEYNCPVMTSQEKDLIFLIPDSIDKQGETIFKVKSKGLNDD